MATSKFSPKMLPLLVERIQKGYDCNQNPLHGIRAEFGIETHFEYLRDIHFEIMGDASAFQEYSLKDTLCVFLEDKKFPINHLDWNDMTEKEQDDFLASEDVVRDTPYYVLVCYNEYWANTEGKSNC